MTIIIEYLEVSLKPGKPGNQINNMWDLSVYNLFNIYQKQRINFTGNEKNDRQDL